MITGIYSTCMSSYYSLQFRYMVRFPSNMLKQLLQGYFINQTTMNHHCLPTQHLLTNVLWAFARHSFLKQLYSFIFHLIVTVSRNNFIPSLLHIVIGGVQLQVCNAIHQYKYTALTSRLRVCMYLERHSVVVTEEHKHR